MNADSKKSIKDVIITIGIVIICLLFLFQVGSCTCNCVRKSNERYRLRSAEIESHYPKRGEKVLLDGKEIVILKRLFWKTERTYQVRMSDGTITQVIGSEIKDKKPIVRDSNNTEEE